MVVVVVVEDELGDELAQYFVQVDCDDALAWGGGGDEVKRKRKARRSKEQMEQDKANEEAEKRRLAVLFECGDTTFTTLRVIDVNL